MHHSVSAISSLLILPPTFHYVGPRSRLSNSLTHYSRRTASLIVPGYLSSFGGQSGQSLNSFVVIERGASIPCAIPLMSGSTTQTISRAISVLVSIYADCTFPGTRGSSFIPLVVSCLKTSKWLVTCRFSTPHLQAPGVDPSPIDRSSARSSRS